jgi:hypothetical protein
MREARAWSTSPMTKHDPNDALPESGDRLFVSSDWAFDAHVMGDPAERFYRLPHGYKQAGDALVLRASAEPRERANLIYPAISNYRQAIELWLKKLIKDYGSGVVMPAALKRNPGHNLADLWARFSAICADRSSIVQPHFDAAKALVHEMHGADEVNDCFRYAADVKSNPFAFGDCNVDLENLYRRMGALTNFFELKDYEFQGQDDR